MHPALRESILTVADRDAVYRIDLEAYTELAASQPDGHPLKDITAEEHALNGEAHHVYNTLSVNPEFLFTFDEVRAALAEGLA